MSGQQISPRGETIEEVIARVSAKFQRVREAQERVEKKAAQIAARLAWLLEEQRKAKAS